MRTIQRVGIITGSLGIVVLFVAQFAVALGVVWGVVGVGLAAGLAMAKWLPREWYGRQFEGGLRAGSTSDLWPARQCCAAEPLAFRIGRRHTACAVLLIPRLVRHGNARRARDGGGRRRGCSCGGAGIRIEQESPYDTGGDAGAAHRPGAQSRSSVGEPPSADDRWSGARPLSAACALAWARHECRAGRHADSAWDARRTVGAYVRSRNAWRPPATGNRSPAACHR